MSLPLSLVHSIPVGGFLSNVCEEGDMMKGMSGGGVSEVLSYKFRICGQFYVAK